MIGSDLLSESNKLCKHSDLDATRRLEELQSEFAEAPPIFISTPSFQREFEPESQYSVRLAIRGGDLQQVSVISQTLLVFLLEFQMLILFTGQRNSLKEITVTSYAIGVTSSSQPKEWHETYADIQEIFQQSLLNFLPFRTRSDKQMHRSFRPSSKVFDKCQLPSDNLTEDGR